MTKQNKKILNYITTVGSLTPTLDLNNFNYAIINPKGEIYTFNDVKDFYDIEAAMRNDNAQFEHDTCIILKLKSLSNDEISVHYPPLITKKQKSTLNSVFLNYGLSFITRY